MSGIQHPYFSNPSFATDGPPSPTPTRLKKRKREDDEEEASTPTKARLRIASDQLGGLALPLERPVAPYARSSHISSPQKQPMTPTSLLKENNLVMTSTPHIPPALPRQDSSSDSLSLLTRSAAPPSPTMRTRAATTPMRLALPLASLALSMPYLLIQPPTSPQHYPSLEASITALRRILSTADDPSPEMALSPEQECFAWVMLAELGIQLVSSFNSSSPSVKEENSSPKKSKADAYVPEWGLKVEEIEDAIARALQLSDRFASLKHLRHRLTLMHAQLALYQDNPKHARVLIKRLLPLSNAAQPIPTDKVWAAYEAHLAIVHSLIGQSEPSDGIRVRESDLAAALSQLNALAMLANGHGDYAVYQLAIVTKWTTLFQHHSTSESEHVTASKLDAALAEAELVLGMDGFDKQLSASTDEKSEEKEKNVSSNITPRPSGQSAGNATPLVQDLLASGGPIHVSANFKTPAFSLPTNPLGMDVYAAVMSESGQPLQSMVDEKSSDMIIPPYMRYLRVHVLMLGVLWLTHCGQSVRCSERLALLHEMMDKMNDLSKDDSDGWAGGDEMGIIQVPVSSNPEQSLRIKVTHPRVLYQLTFAISASAKRDGAGKRPKRKIFVEEGLRVGSVDDPRTSNPTLSILEGGPLLSFGRGLGVADSVHAQRAIAYIRAINYCELISVCLIRSEFDDADRYLNETVSYIRAVDNNNSSAVADTATGNGHPLTEGGDLWKAFAPRVTLLHGQLAHALGKAPLALECYRIAAYMDERSNGNAGLSVIGALAVAGEVFVRVGLLKQGGEPFQFQGEVDDEQSILELASEVSEGCLQGAWGEGMIVVGRIIAAAVTDEVIRAKQNLRAALDLSSKSRDNYLRLLVLVLTAGQYVDTSFDYAAKILETTRQLASGLGAVTSAAAPVDAADGRTIRSAQAQGKDSNLYQVGHARAGLWIGQRFSELYRRAGESSKAAKQNALNDVFVRAIAATNARATSEAYSSLSVFRDFDAMFPKVEPPVEPPVQLSKEQGKKQKQQRTKKEKRKHTRATTASTLELFSPLETRGVWSRDTDGEEDWGTEPPSSQATSTSSTQGYRHFSQSSTQSSFSAASSTGTRHSTRSSRGPRKILVESDDEDHPAGHRGEEDDEWEEEEED